MKKVFAVNAFEALLIPFSRQNKKNLKYNLVCMSFLCILEKKDQINTV